MTATEQLALLKRIRKAAGGEFNAALYEDLQEAIHELEDAPPITPLALWGNTGKQLDSLDSVEDAVSILRESEFNFILLVGTHEHASTIQSDLTNEAAAMLTDWNANGVLQADFASHLGANYPRE